MILFTIISSLIYWLFSALLNDFFLPGKTFLKEIFNPGFEDGITRLAAVLFLILFCVYSRLVFNKRCSIEKQLNDDYDLIPLVLDKINSLVVVFDSLGRIVRFNCACEQLTGYTFEEVRGKYFWKIFLSEKNADEVKSMLMKVKTGNFPKEYEERWLTKEGSCRLIKWSNTVVLDKKKAKSYIISAGIDISGHQSVEDFLKKSEKEYKDIIENIGIGISFISAERKIVYMNKQMEKWFPLRSTLDSSPCHNVISGIDNQVCTECPTCLVFKDGKTHEAIVKICLEEKILPCKVVSFPVEDRQGKIVAAIETIEDFTEVDKRESESKYKFFAQAVLNSLLRFSLENISLDGFLKCALNVILTAPVFSGSSIGAISVIDDKTNSLTLKVQNQDLRISQKQTKEDDLVSKLQDRALSTGKMQFAGILSVFSDSRNKQKDQCGCYVVPILYRSNVLGTIDLYFSENQRKGKQEEEFFIVLASTLAGIIHHKRFESRLRKTNECFASLGVDPSKNIQNLVKLCGEILEATSVFYNCLTPQADKFYSAGCYNSDFHYIEEFEASGSVGYDLINKQQKGPLVINNFSKTIYAKTDACYLNHKFQSYVGQVIESRGILTGVLNIIFQREFSLGEEDRRFLSVISLAVGVEEERINARNQLQEAYSKLEEAQQGLVQSEKLAALGRFSSGIAHEVKNPLGVILGGIEFLEKKLSSSDEIVNTAIRKIKESTLRADSIVRNLLKFAMPSEAKKIKLRPQDLINDTLALLKYRVSLINIDIKTDFSKENIHIEVDKNQLGQVLFNILINAIEAMPKRGRIKVKTYKATIKEFSFSKQVCVMEINDSGEGVSKEDLAKLFEPFFTTKRDKKGTGLGLSMSKMIVENHKGTLSIESEAGKGATVKINLPYVEQDDCQDIGQIDG